MKIVATLLFAAIGLATVNARDAKVTLGNAAPPIKYTEWLKGKELKKFEPGKVYVVEFWATWCGPCKQSIPHLTELAHKYGDKVSFNGFSIWEESHPEKTDAELDSRVRKFVKDWGDKMDYNVAMGGKGAAMSQSWMSAAGQGGIPTAFVIDQQGRVAWIGHPMVGLDKVLDKVLDGSWDIKAEADRQAKAREEQEKFAAMMKPFSDAMRAKDYKTALTEIDKLMASNPNMEMGMAATKFDLLLRTDEKAAYPYARKLASGVYKSQAMALNQIAWSIVDDKSIAKDPDYATAVAVAQQGADVVKPDSDEAAFMYDTLAYALYKSGDVEKAMEASQKAVAAAERKGTSVDEATRKEVKDRLEMLKAKKGKG